MAGEAYSVIISGKMVNSLKWSVGEVEIYQIVEIEDAGDVIQGVIGEAKPAEVREIRWMYPRFADRRGRLKAQVQCFLVKSEGKNILIDSCNGNNKRRTDLAAWSYLRTNFLRKLGNIGLTPEDIDVVVCTHLHCDHVGWNTILEKGRWVPTFPKAKYVFVKKEYDYWAERPEKEIADDKAAFADSVMPVVKSGLAEFVGTDHAVDGYISFIPSPGHTPGHISVAIDANGKKALISGDFLHHPCQISRPEWSTDSDTFPRQAEESRRKILEEIADQDVLLIGSHFADPVAGKVKRFRSGYIFVI